MNKKTLYSVIVLLFLFIIFACTSSPTIHEQSNATQDNLNVITLPPYEMVRPSENVNAMLAYNMGTELMRQNRLEEAERFLKIAIDLDPEFVDALDHLGIVLRRQNRLDEAEEIYLRSISLNNENKVPFINLALIYRIQGRLNDSMQLYRRVIEIDRFDPEGYFGMGTLFFIIDDYNNAMTLFNLAEVLYLNQNSPIVTSVYFYKGLIYFNTGNYDEALGYLEEAKKGMPDNETIDRVISEIRNR